MVFVNTQMGGQHFAFPDVCRTPSPAGPVPIPYPNTALPPTAIPSQFTVLVQGMPAHNLMTTVPMSNGDNAGVATNPVSNMVMGPCKHMKGSLSTFFGGSPATRMLDPTGQNGTSPGAFGMSIVPSQETVLVLS